MTTLPETGFLRLPQVLRFYPVSPTDWWNGVKAGTYPPSYKLGRNKTAWRAEDIKALIDNTPQNPRA